MSETKAAFAERTTRSLKNILYRYMEDYGYKYIRKMSQFVTTMKSKKFCSIDFRPKSIKNFDSLTILYSKPLRGYIKPKFKIGGRVRKSKFDSHFRKAYIPQFTQEVFEIGANSSRKPPTHRMKDEQDEIIHGKLHQKELISQFTKKSFTIELVSNASAQLFPDKTMSSYTTTLPEQLNLKGQWEVAISEICHPSVKQNVTEAMFFC